MLFINADHLLTQAWSVADNTMDGPRLALSHFKI